MNIDDLKKLGLSKIESSLYLRLLNLGASDVQTLVNDTGFYKSNVYDALERLCEKGIISKIIEGNKRIYQLQKPESLIEFIDKKQDELQKQKKIAEELAKNVKIAKKHIHSQETAMVFKGFSGVKQVYSEIIDERLDYLVFGSPKESESIGDYYWQNLHLKQKQNNIHSKMIFHNSLRNWKRMIPKDIIKLRFFEGKFEPLTETVIYGSKVAFVVWTKIPITTIINNQHVSDSYRLVFDVLWKQAKS
jgi:predicted transcriptional regulator